MNRSRITGDLVSQNNIFVDIANDRVGIGSTIPAHKLSLPDSARISMGDSAEFQIYHNGSNSLNYIVAANNGPLLLRSSNADMIHCSPQGAVTLKHNGQTKTATTDYGLNVTGTIDTDGLVVSGVSTFSDDVTFLGTNPSTSANKIIFDKSNNHMRFFDSTKINFGQSGDLEIYHQSSVSYIDCTNTSPLHIQSDDLRIRKQDGSEEMITAVANGTVRLFYDGSQRLTTTDYGIDVTGTTGTDGLAVSGVSTFSGASTFNATIKISNAIKHIGDENTVIRFPADDNISMETAGSERFRIDGNGRLLVGTTSNRQTRLGTSGFSPDMQLESDTVAAFSMTRWHTGTSPSRLSLQKGRGTIASPAVVADGDQTGQILFNAWDGDTFTNTAQIRSEVDGTPGDDQMPGMLVFATNSGGTATTTAMVIRADGKIGMNVTDPTTNLQIGAGTVDSDNVITLGKRVSSSESNLPKIGHHSDDGSSSSLALCATSSSGKIHFFTGNGGNGFGASSNAERMRIDSAGRLSLGVNASPGSYPVGATARQVQAEIKGAIDTSNNKHDGSLAINCTNNNANLHLIRSDNNQSANVGLSNISFSGFDGTDYHVGAQISAIRDAAGGNNDIPARLVLLTTADGASTPTERLRIKSDGTIKIGGTAGFSETGIPLQVHNPSAAGSQMQFTGSGTGATTVSRGFRVGYNGSGGQLWNFENTYVRFATNNLERVYITSGGYVNIGDDFAQTTYKTQIETTDGNVLRLVTDSDDANGPELVLRKDSASPADNDNIGNIYFQGNDSGGNDTFYASMEAYSSDVSNGSEDGYIRFRTRLNGTMGERLRIASDGQLVMTNAATQTFFDFSTTNNSTRGLFSIAGKDSSGNAITIRIGGFGDTSRGEIFTHSNHGLGFATNNASTQMVLGTNGCLSIGKNGSQGKALELYQSADAALRIQNSTTGTGSNDGILIEAGASQALIWNYESTPMKFGTAGSERLHIRANGSMIAQTGSLSTTPLMELYNTDGNAQTGTVLKLRTGRGQSTKDMPIFHITDSNDDSVFEVENSGRVGIFNASPAYMLDIVNNTSANGIRLRSTGSTYHDFYFDAARTGANQHIGRIIAEWNGNNTSMISMNTGDDTTNKDNGYISFCASGASSTLTERFRCQGSVAGLVMQNDCYIEIPHDERCIVFDEGQKMITSNDGQGNFNMFGGKNHDAVHVSSSSGNSGIAQMEINSDGANGAIHWAVGPTRSAGSSASFEKGFRMEYHTNTSADRLNGLKYTTGTSTSPSGLATQYPIIHKGNASDGTWARVAGDGFKVLGDGGSIAITTNDGYGNCNVCWNHKDGIPDTAGSAWRIRCDIDTGSSDMNFQTAASVSNGSAVSTGSRMVLASNGNLQIDGSLSTSDQRFKTNIQTITGATDKIKALTGKTFKWKDGLEMPSGTKYGFIAQEVESVVPDLVNESRMRGFDKDGNIIQDHYHNKDDIVEWGKGVDDSGITPILVEALKEAIAKIETLEAKVAALEGS